MCIHIYIYICYHALIYTYMWTCIYILYIWMSVLYNRIYIYLIHTSIWQYVWHCVDLHSVLFSCLISACLLHFYVTSVSRFRLGILSCALALVWRCFLCLALLRRLRVVKPKQNLSACFRCVAQRVPFLLNVWYQHLFVLCVLPRQPVDLSWALKIGND